jgi:hypothetical protein
MPQTPPWSFAPADDRNAPATPTAGGIALAGTRGFGKGPVPADHSEQKLNVVLPFCYPTG